MCLRLSLAAKPYIGEFLSQNCKFRGTRAEAVANPEKSSIHSFPRVLRSGIPLTNLQVDEIVDRQSIPNNLAKQETCRNSGFLLCSLKKPTKVAEGYVQNMPRTFYLVWWRRTDELADGPNANYTRSTVLDRSWEKRLEDIFNGRPYDMLDAALSDTVLKFPVDIKTFRDMIEGMRMDIRKRRYENFQELYLCCYCVAGTVGLMSVPVMGIAPESSSSVQSIYDAALYLGNGNQLTNIRRDVVKDAMIGRVYLPRDQLAQFGLRDRDVFARKVTYEWREFMKEQIRRARCFFNLAAGGASDLEKAGPWPVWSALTLYRKILDAIED